MTVADDEMDTLNEKFEATHKGSWQKRSLSIGGSAAESKVRACSSSYVNFNKCPQSTLSS
jgi:hypothetical protein